MAERRDEQLTELEELYARYEVYDRNGEKIGKVGHLSLWMRTTGRSTSV